jgi:hypothetical protein
MSHSKDIVDSNITSDGYILRYGQKEIWPICSCKS